MMLGTVSQLSSAAMRPVSVQFWVRLPAARLNGVEFGTSRRSSGEQPRRAREIGRRFGRNRLSQSNVIAGILEARGYVRPGAAAQQGVIERRGTVILRMRAAAVVKVPRIGSGTIVAGCTATKRPEE